MPSAETLQSFIARVEQNAHAEAVEEFYTANASFFYDPAQRVPQELTAAESRSS